MHQGLAELQAALQEIDDLHSASALLTWDQMTYMPPGGASARGRQLALLGRLAHERQTDPSLGRLLDTLRRLEESLPYDADEAGMIRVARREYERAVKVPPEFVSRLRSHASATYETWVKARAADDFAAVRPYLEKTLELSKELANYYPGYEHIADPLIGLEDYGFKASAIRDLFTELRTGLVPIVRAISSQPAADDSCLHQHFPATEQLAFGLEIAGRFGYDLERGRQDQSPHPFTIKFSLNDVRITTRVKPDDLTEALFSTMHETGHALYEQGIDPAFEGTPLGAGASAGVHESQSRLWENLVGRSYGFWRFFYPKLQRVFPGQLGDVPLDAFYRAVNRVQRSLIRTDADEVTYNLHVILRFDLELAMLEGRLSVGDLPAAWRERYQADLGLSAPDDRDGVLQDIHWFDGVIGGVFQGYTLGNIMGTQFYEAAVRAHPEIPAEIERGCFDILHGWLRENVYRHGGKFTATELVERACGQPLSVKPYLSYLRKKYGGLYEL